MDSRQAPLPAALCVALALGAPDVLAATHTVTSCSDAGAGSLRATVASAASGDTIDFDTAAMGCSKITLTTGSIATSLDDLTLTGPGAGVLSIDSGIVGTDRVLAHYGNGTLTVQGLTLTRGGYSTKSGACIFGKTVVVNNSVLYGCAGYNDGIKGGGIYASGDLHLSNSTISHCSVFGFSLDAFGGGAYVMGNAYVQSSTITSNSSNSTGPGYADGGLVVRGNVTVANSTFSNNSGGGLTVPGGSGSVVITSSTFSGNSAKICAGINSVRPITLANSTIAFNTSFQSSVGGTEYAAGVCDTALSLSLQSSIIANNTAGSGAAAQALDLMAPGPITVVGANNLVMSKTLGTITPPGTLTADPLLNALANNGGPTTTHSLQLGSPAIGTGNNAARLGFDQRGPGFARMTGEHTDMGAVQSGDGIFANGFE